MSGKFHEVGVVTDVCCADAMPEVELVSLVSETLPRYKLRADTMTEFAGYTHSDWSQCPSAGSGGGGKPSPGGGGESGRPSDGLAEEEDDEDYEFTDAQIENLLDYFILCGLRVNQMTKTYNDVDAVTQLLVEKERDLELAATIGKKLLEKNKKLEEQVELLEEQLRTSTDEVRQLRHELSLKDDLLRIYVEDAEDATGDDPVTDNSLSHASSTPSSFSFSRINIEQLQRKVQELQDENIELRAEQHTMSCTAQRFEEKEQTLMKDCLQQLTEANLHIRNLSEELTKKTDKCMQQQEDVTCLLAKNIDLEARVKQLMSDNEFASIRFKDSETNRESMNSQLTELRDRYDECLALLAEAQSESRDLRRRHRRHTRHSKPLAFPDSVGDLASELALASRRSSVLLEVESDPEDDRTEASGSVRVMDAVRRLRHHQPASLESNQDTSAAVRSAELYSCSSLSATSLSQATWEMESEAAAAEAVVEARRQLRAGFPPLASPPPNAGRVEGGSRAAAMVTAGREQRKGASIPGSASFSSPPQPRQGHETVELSAGSYLSTGSDVVVGGSGGREMVQSWLSNAPEKLQIVKPIEGSLTLRQWQHLATPSLSRALFESPPAGIHVRGGKNRQVNTEEEEEDTAFSDVEEDDALCLSKPGDTHAAADASGSTHLHSTRMTADSGHPTTPPTFTSDSHVTSPYSSSSSCFSNPEHSARMARHNISSLSPGLARILCERGIHSQAAVATVAAMSSSENTSSSGEESEANQAPPMPPLYHAQLLESINRVGHRLWHALTLPVGDGAAITTTAAMPGLATQTSSSSSSTMCSVTSSGLNCCLSPTSTTPTGPRTARGGGGRGGAVLRRTDR